MSVYLVFGNEPYLIDNKLKEILDQNFSKDDEMKDYNIDILSSDEVYNKYSIAIETLPFMGDKRMVIFKRCELFKQKITKKEEDILDYLEQLVCSNTAKDIVVVIIEGEKVDKRKKLYKAISNKGKIIECNKLSNNELKKWMREKLIKQNKSFNPKVLEYLVNNLSNDLYLVNNEIEKLIAFVGDKEYIEESDLHICSFTVNESVYKLIDYIVSKKLNSALQLLRSMLREGEAAMVILYMIIKQLRNIATAKSLSSKGYTLKQIGEIIGVQHPYALSQLLRHCDSFTISSSQKSLELAAEYDTKIKTGQVDFEKGLELLISKLIFTS